MLLARLTFINSSLRLLFISLFFSTKEVLNVRTYVFEYINLLEIFEMDFKIVPGSSCSPKSWPREILQWRRCYHQSPNSISHRKTLAEIASKNIGWKLARVIFLFLFSVFIIPFHNFFHSQNRSEIPWFTAIYVLRPFFFVILLQNYS